MPERQVVQFELGERRNSGCMPNITELLWMVILLSCPMWWWCNMQLKQGKKAGKEIVMFSGCLTVTSNAVKCSYFIFHDLKLR